MDPLTSEELQILREQLLLKERELREKELRLQHKEEVLDEEREDVAKQFESIRAVTDREDNANNKNHAQNDRLKDLFDIINEQQNVNRSMQDNLVKVMNEVRNLKTDRPSSRAAMFTADVWGDPSEINPPITQNAKTSTPHATSPPSGQTRLPNLQNQPPINIPNIKYKDALESVPTFTGYNIPVLRFTRACQKVKNLFGPHHEPNLLLLLRNKLRGHAQTALEDDNSYTIKEFIDQLKLLFGSSKSVNEYRGELGSIIKFPADNAIQYISRVKDLHFAILEMDTEIWGPLNPEHRAQCERDTMESFIKGLPPDFRIRVRQEPYRNMEELFAKAIAVEKEIAVDQRFSKLAGPPLPPRNVRAALASRPPCSHCNKTGHEPENCWAAFPEKRPKRDNNRGNYNNNRGNYNNNRSNYNNNSYNQNNNFNRENPNNANNNPNRPQCTYCDKMGHYEAKCFKKQSDQAKNGNPRPTEQGSLGEQQQRPVNPTEMTPSAPSTSA